MRVLVEDMGSTDWGVFDDEGRFMGTVAYPVDCLPQQVVDDRFYGIARDELGAESVRAFRVITP